MAILTKYSDVATKTFLATGISGTTFYSIRITGVDHVINLAMTFPGAIQDAVNALLISLGFRYTCYVIAGVDFSIYYTEGFTINNIVTMGGLGANTYIPLEINNTYLRDYRNESMASMLDTIAVNVLTAPVSLNYGTCPCSCEFEEKVFAGASETNFYTSDKTGYLFKKIFNSDSYSIKLYKNGAAVGIDITSAIADVYTYGDLTRDGVADNNYAGFHIQWYRVFTIHGYGSYQLIGTYTKLGTTYAYESHTFKLTAYNINVAKGTVKIEAVQNGYFENEDMDTTGLTVPGGESGWYQSVRVEGKLWKGLPKLTLDNYLDNDLIVEQIQDSILDDYILELLPLPAEIINYIAYNVSMANQMLISDYNVNPEVYNQLDLMITEIQEFKTWAGNTNTRGTFKCAPRQQNQIKRNFI